MEMLMLTGDSIRDGLFNYICPNWFGNVGTELIARLCKYGPPKSKHHDLYDYRLNRRIEVKMTRILRVHGYSYKLGASLETMLDVLASCREVYFDDWPDCSFHGSFHQVKPAHFDELCYISLFYDCAIVCKTTPEAVKNDFGYGLRSVNSGVDEGSFSLNRSVLDYHLDKFFYRQVSYDEMAELMRQPLPKELFDVEPKSSTAKSKRRRKARNGVEGLPAAALREEQEEPLFHDRSGELDSVASGILANT
jgi:hypothetical protein